MASDYISHDMHPDQASSHERVLTNLIYQIVSGSMLIGNVPINSGLDVLIIVKMN